MYYLYSLSSSLSLPVPFLESPKYSPQHVESGHALTVNMSLPHPHPLLRAKSENTMATPPDPIAPPTTAPATAQVGRVSNLLSLSVAGIGLGLTLSIGLHL